MTSPWRSMETRPGVHHFPHGNTPYVESVMPQLREKKLDDGWPESEKNVFQTALIMVVVKNSR